MPEQLPSAEHIKEVEKCIKTVTPKLKLDKRDAIGLLGEQTPDEANHKNSTGKDSKP